MGPTIFLITCLVALPLAAHLRQWQPAALFASATLVYAVFDGIGFVNFQIFLSNIHSQEAQLHDTYYVVNHGNMGLGLGAVMALMALLTWVQTRLGAMRYPRQTRLLFWPFHLGLIGSNSVAIILAHLLPHPRRYIDYPDFVAVLNTVSSWALLLGTATGALLVSLMIWSVFLRWTSGLQG